jgi:arginase
MSVWPVDRLRAEGHQAVTAAVLERVARVELDGFWVHLDVDILDPEVMPAVDTLSEGGLQPSELTELLSGLVSHTAAIGMDVCIFDPDLDPDGQHAQTLTPVVRETLRNAAAAAPPHRT